MPTQLNIQVRGFGAMVLGQIAYLEPVQHGHLCTHRIDFTILWDYLLGDIRAVKYQREQRHVSVFVLYDRRSD